MSVVTPSQDGQSLVPKPELSSLSSDVLIRKVLPFMGGVRSVQNRQTMLQKDLKEFMALTYRYCETVNTSRSNNPYHMGEYEFDSLRIPSRSEKVEALIQMFVALSVDPQRKRRDILSSFGAKGWLGLWIKWKDISMGDLELFPMDVWMMWVEAHMFK